MRYNVQVSENKTKFSCGCSSMVEHQPSKLDTWVRFPSPALIRVNSSAGQSNGLLSRRSGVRIPSGTLNSDTLFVIWWVQRGWLARQIVALEALGSNPSIHLLSLLESQQGFFSNKGRICRGFFLYNDGLSPSGKAQDFDSCTRGFESRQPSTRETPADVVCRGFCLFWGGQKRRLVEKLVEKKSRKMFLREIWQKKISLNPYKQGAEGKISCKSKKLVDQERLVLRAFFSF